MQRDAPPEARRKLQESLVLVHGGMAQNVGPILEMVTEKYLLRSEAEWQARQEALGILDEILAALRAAGRAENRRGHFAQFPRPDPNHHSVGEQFLHGNPDRAGAGGIRRGFLGLLDAGRHVGRRHGVYISRPRAGPRRRNACKASWPGRKRELESALPFAMEPVVYDFAINEKGTWADLLTGGDALLPPHYYALVVPQLLKLDLQTLPPLRRAELDKFAAASRNKPELGGVVQDVFDRLLPRLKQDASGGQSLAALLEENGFDRAEHEQIRADLKDGRIGLAQNRLPASATIEDVQAEDVVDATGPLPEEYLTLGRQALANGEAAVVTLAAGIGSRWTQGAGVVKALHPFCKLAGKHRTFLEVHLAKSRRIGSECGLVLPHVITTSYLTHGPIENFAGPAKELRICRPAAALAGPGHRTAPGPDGARSAFFVGGNAAANAR